VLIEIVLGFVLPRCFELADVLRLTVGEAIGFSTRVVLLARGALACCAKIDQITH
jgi:hypothetical protein